MYNIVIKIHLNKEIFSMKRHLIIFMSTAILFFGITLPVFANMISISGLYDTGVNNAGTVLAAGALDMHYILSDSPLGSYGITTVIPRAGSWIEPPSGSNWIGPQAHSEGLTSDPGGYYSYIFNFSLTGLNPNTASISGKWATDNTGVLLLNGISMSTANGFGSLTSFMLTGPNFRDGNNTLEFKVYNIPQGGYPGTGNPSGLLVSGLQGTASAVPLPPAIMLLAPGLIGLAGLRKRNNI
jgi:hypothetical protein